MGLHSHVKGRGLDDVYPKLTGKIGIDPQCKLWEFILQIFSHMHADMYARICIQHYL